MFVKKIKRKCDVRGCKNIADVYLISKRRDMSNTVAMCRDCLKEALSSTEGYVEVPKVKAEPKPLFPHPELEVTLSSVAEVEPEPVEVIENVTEDIQISVAEDTVTIEEPVVVETPKATAKSNKKKANKR